MSGRSRIVYVTQDGTRWLAVDVPQGLIAPPTISLHEPFQGAVEFLDAQCYGLAIPAAASTP